MPSEATAARAGRQGAGPRRDRPDVRLLLPALTSWAVTAAVLGRPGWVVLGTLLAVLAVLGITAWRRLRAPASAAALTALGLVAVAGHHALDEAGPVRALASERAQVTLVARVTSDPRLVGNGAERARKAMLSLTVLEVTGRGRRSVVGTPVLAFADPSWAAIGWHTQVRVHGRLSPPDEAGDAVAVLSVRGPPEVLSGPGPVDRAAEHVRARFRAACAGLPDDAKGLVPALVIGDTSATPADLTQAMKRTSLTHLSAVSGSNVSVVLAAVLWLCGLVGVPRRARVPVALAALAGFVVLARPEPSVLRAAVMGAVGLAAVTGSRARLGMPSLGAAITVLLVVDPWLARSFGFALSALATLGLLLFARPWGLVLERHLPGWCGGLGPALAVPLAAQVTCAPLTLLLQPGISVVGVPANLVAEPFVAPATAAGVVVALAAVVLPQGSPVLAWLAGAPALAIAQVARCGAQLPLGSLPWPEGPPGVLLLVVLTAALLLSGRRLWHLVLLRPVLALAGAGALAAGSVPTTFATWPAPGWSVVACDVGQGDGLVLRSGPGHVVVVDVGPDGERMRGCLSRLGTKHVDAVVLTHFHADHVDGLATVLDSVRVGQVLTTIVDEPRDQADMVARVLRDRGMTAGRLRQGDRLDIGLVHAEVLWPARRLDAGSVPNNASIVLLADVAGTRALLTGDVEREAAHEVLLALRRSGAGPVDVLKVAHHGSSNQDPQLVLEARAALAVVSVGKNNDYGHPAPVTLALLQRAGTRVVRTDECGDIAVVGHAATLAVGCRGP